MPVWLPGAVILLHLHELVLDDGDRHVTTRAGRNG